MSATTRQLISIRASIVQIIIHRASRITGYRAAHVTLRELEKINSRLRDDAILAVSFN